MEHDLEPSIVPGSEILVGSESKVMPCSHQFRLCSPDLIHTRWVEGEVGRLQGGMA